MAQRQYQGTWILHIDPEYKKVFKILAVQQERPVYEVINEALAEYARNHGLVSTR